MGSFGSAFHDSINVGIPDDFTPFSERYEAFTGDCR